MQKGGEIEWLKERLAEALAGLDSPRDEVEGLRGLNSAREMSVSSVSFAGTPLYHLGGGGGHRPLGRLIQCAQPRFPHQGRRLRTTGSGIGGGHEAGNSFNGVKFSTFP